MDFNKIEKARSFDILKKPIMIGRNCRMRKIILLLVVAMTLISGCVKEEALLKIVKKEGNELSDVERHGGYIITFVPETENPEPEEMDIAKVNIAAYLDEKGYNLSVVTKKDSVITAEIPRLENPEEILNDIDTINDSVKVTFRDSEGNILLDGATDIASAEYRYGQISEYGSAEHHIALAFTKEGTEKFAEATKIVSEKTEGNNYISIYLDDEEISCPRVSEPIYQSSCVISGSFTEETARTFAVQINRKSTPFKLRIDTVNRILPQGE